MTIYLLDTETTNNKPPMEVIELAWENLIIESYEPVSPNNSFFVDKFFGTYFCPEGEITFGAMATHHILKQDLLYHQPSKLAPELLPKDLEYLIGHNIIFDWKALGKPKCKRICTLSLARYLYSEETSHTLSAMMFHCYEKEEWPKLVQLLKDAHCASQDVAMNRTLLNHLIEKLIERGELSENFTIEEFYKLSQEVYIPKVMTFGKWAGVQVSNVPTDYIKWFLNQSEIDEPFELAFRKELSRRFA